MARKRWNRWRGGGVAAVLIGALLLVLLTAENLLTAGDDAKAATRLNAIQKEVADAEAIFRDAWAKLPDPYQEDPTVGKLFKVFDDKRRAGFDAVLEIAKADPKSDAGFGALEWLLMTPLVYSLPVGKPSLELMTEHHAANPKIGKTIARLSYYMPYGREPNKLAIALLKTVAEKNPDRTARGQAVLGLAWLAKRYFQEAESKGAADTDRLARQAEKSFETVLRDYGDCRNLRSKGVRPATATLAEEVEPELYELRRLRIDKLAPDIDGEDLSGAKFQLRDHRGKVVLLVFWASWCGPCMASVPHEKELLEHFKNRPFVLVGVNGDEKKESAQKAVQKYRIPWRSFWNEEKGPGGSIVVAWNVRGWPTVYVIDHKGTIRQKYLHGKRLDDPLEKLVAEAEMAAKAAGR